MGAAAVGAAHRRCPTLDSAPAAARRVYSDSGGGRWRAVQPAPRRRRGVAVASVGNSSSGGEEEAARSESGSGSYLYYPAGDWRHDALRGSLSDKEKIHRESQGRNHTYMVRAAAGAYIRAPFSAQLLSSCP
mmetsp:Transcript_14863/g.35879  ORF Transcript_14863/g.35879 Transcript_14863/m.35879 type:complete len:132 (-) Transcript_14863:195-590(-)